MTKFLNTEIDFGKRPTLSAAKLVFAVIALFALGVIFGVIGYLISTQKAQIVIVQSTPTLTPSPTVTSDIDISDWKTYSKENENYEFKYPPDFIFFKVPEVLVSSIDPTGLSVKICHEGISGNTIIKKVTAGENTFCSYTTEDGAAGTIYTDYKYSIIKDNKDYTINFVIPHTNCENISDQTAQKYINCEEFNNKTIPETINQILSTFKFLK